MTKDELMAACWRITVIAPYDSPGTIRTGREWFNRYMLHPWERGSDFERVLRVMMRITPFWEEPDVKTACITRQSMQDSTRLK